MATPEQQKPWAEMDAQQRREYVEQTLAPQLKTFIESQREQGNLSAMLIWLAVNDPKPASIDKSALQSFLYQNPSDPITKILNQFINDSDQAGTVKILDLVTDGLFDTFLDVALKVDANLESVSEFANRESEFVKKAGDFLLSHQKPVVDTIKALNKEGNGIDLSGNFAGKYKEIRKILETKVNFLKVDSENIRLMVWMLIYIYTIDTTDESPNRWEQLMNELGIQEDEQQNVPGPKAASEDVESGITIEMFNEYPELKTIVELRKLHDSLSAFIYWLQIYEVGEDRKFLAELSYKAIPYEPSRLDGLVDEIKKWKSTNTKEIPLEQAIVGASVGMISKSLYYRDKQIHYKKRLYNTSQWLQEAIIVELVYAGQVEELNNLQTEKARQEGLQTQYDEEFKEVDFNKLGQEIKQKLYINPQDVKFIEFISQSVSYNPDLILKTLGDLSYNSNILRLIASEFNAVLEKEIRLAEVKEILIHLGSTSFATELISGILPQKLKSDFSQQHNDIARVFSSLIPEDRQKKIDLFLLLTKSIPASETGITNFHIIGFDKDIAEILTDTGVDPYLLLMSLKFMMWQQGYAEVLKLIGIDKDLAADVLLQDSAKVFTRGAGIFKYLAAGSDIDQLAEMKEHLPDVFDSAHLWFNDAPKVLPELIGEDIADTYGRAYEKVPARPAVDFNRFIQEFVSTLSAELREEFTVILNNYNSDRDLGVFARSIIELMDKSTYNPWEISRALDDKMIVFLLGFSVRQGKLDEILKITNSYEGNSESEDDFISEYEFEDSYQQALDQLMDNLFHNLDRKYDQLAQFTSSELLKYVVSSIAGRSGFGRDKILEFLINELPFTRGEIRSSIPDGYTWEDLFGRESRIPRSKDKGVLLSERLDEIKVNFLRKWKQLPRVEGLDGELAKFIMEHPSKDLIFDAMRRVDQLLSEDVYFARFTPEIYQKIMDEFGEQLDQMNPGIKPTELLVLGIFGLHANQEYDFRRIYAGGEPRDINLSGNVLTMQEQPTLEPPTQKVPQVAEAPEKREQRERAERRSDVRQLFKNVLIHVARNQQPAKLTLQTKEEVWQLHQLLKHYGARGLGLDNYALFTRPVKDSQLTEAYLVKDINLLPDDPEWSSDTTDDEKLIEQIRLAGYQNYKLPADASENGFEPIFSSEAQRLAMNAADSVEATLGGNPADTIKGKLAKQSLDSEIKQAYQEYQIQQREWYDLDRVGRKVKGVARGAGNMLRKMIPIYGQFTGKKDQLSNVGSWQGGKLDWQTEQTTTNEFSFAGKPITEFKDLSDTALQTDASAAIRRQLHLIDNKFIYDKQIQILRKELFSGYNERATMFMLNKVLSNPSNFEALKEVISPPQKNIWDFKLPPEENTDLYTDLPAYNEIIYLDASGNLEVNAVEFNKLAAMLDNLSQNLHRYIERKKSDQAGLKKRKKAWNSFRQQAEGEHLSNQFITLFLNDDFVSDFGKDKDIVKYAPNENTNLELERINQRAKDAKGERAGQTRMRLGAIYDGIQAGTTLTMYAYQLASNIPGLSAGVAKYLIPSGNMEYARMTSYLISLLPDKLQQLKEENLEDTLKESLGSLVGAFLSYTAGSGIITGVNGLMGQGQGLAQGAMRLGTNMLARGGASMATLFTLENVLGVTSEKQRRRLRETQSALIGALVSFGRLGVFDVVEDALSKLAENVGESFGQQIFPEEILEQDNVFDLTRPGSGINVENEDLLDLVINEDGLVDEEEINALNIRVLDQYSTVGVSENPDDIQQAITDNTYRLVAENGELFLIDETTNDPVADLNVHMDSEGNQYFVIAYEDPNTRMSGSLEYNEAGEIVRILPTETPDVATSTSQPSVTPSPTLDLVSPTEQVEAIVTEDPTATELPTQTNTLAPSATATATNTATATDVPTDLPTNTATATTEPTATDVATETNTPDPTNTMIPTNTPTATDVPTETTIPTEESTPFVLAEGLENVADQGSDLINADAGIDSELIEHPLFFAESEISSVRENTQAYTNMQNHPFVQELRDWGVDNDYIDNLSYVSNSEINTTLANRGGSYGSTAFDENLDVRFILFRDANFDSNFDSSGNNDYLYNVEEVTQGFVYQQLADIFQANAETLGFEEGDTLGFLNALQGDGIDGVDEGNLRAFGEALQTFIIDDIDSSLTTNNVYGYEFNGTGYSNANISGLISDAKALFIEEALAELGFTAEDISNTEFVQFLLGMQPLVNDNGESYEVDDFDMGGFVERFGMDKYMPDPNVEGNYILAVDINSNSNASSVELTGQPEIISTSTPDPTSTSTSTATNTAAATNTTVPTSTVTATTEPTATDLATDLATETPDPTATDTPTATNTTVPTETDIPTQTETSTVVPTNTVAPSATASAAATETEIASATITPEPTGIDTQVPLATNTTESTETPVATSAPTEVEPTVTSTPEPTSTTVPTDAATAESTQPNGMTNDNLITETPIPPATEVDPTATAIPTDATTNTPTVEASDTATITPSPTDSATNTPVATSTNEPTATQDDARDVVAPTATSNPAEINPEISPEVTAEAGGGGMQPGEEIGAEDVGAGNIPQPVVEPTLLDRLEDFEDANGILDLDDPATEAAIDNANLTVSVEGQTYDIEVEDGRIILIDPSNNDPVALATITENGTRTIMGDDVISLDTGDTIGFVFESQGESDPGSWALVYDTDGEIMLHVLTDTTVTVPGGTGMPGGTFSGLGTNDLPPEFRLTINFAENTWGADTREGALRTAQWLVYLARTNPSVVRHLNIIDSAGNIDWDAVHYRVLDINAYVGYGGDRDGDPFTGLDWDDIAGSDANAQRAVQIYVNGTANNSIDFRTEAELIAALGENQNYESLFEAIENNNPNITVTTSSVGSATFTDLSDPQIGVLINDDNTVDLITPDGEVLAQNVDPNKPDDLDKVVEAIESLEKTIAMSVVGGLLGAAAIVILGGGVLMEIDRRRNWAEARRLQAEQRRALGAAAAAGAAGTTPAATTGADDTDDDDSDDDSSNLGAFRPATTPRQAINATPEQIRVTRENNFPPALAKRVKLNTTGSNGQLTSIGATALEVRELQRYSDDPNKVPFIKLAEQPSEIQPGLRQARVAIDLRDNPTATAAFDPMDLGFDFEFDRENLYMVWDDDNAYLIMQHAFDTDYVVYDLSDNQNQSRFGVPNNQLTSNAGDLEIRFVGGNMEVTLQAATAATTSRTAQGSAELRKITAAHPLFDTRHLMQSNDGDIILTRVEFDTGYSDPEVYDYLLLFENMDEQDIQGKLNVRNSPTMQYGYVYCSEVANQPHEDIFVWFDEATEDLLIEKLKEKDDYQGLVDQLMSSRFMIQVTSKFGDPVASYILFADGSRLVLSDFSPSDILVEIINEMFEFKLISGFGSGGTARDLLQVTLKPQGSDTGFDDIEPVDPDDPDSNDDGSTGSSSRFRSRFGGSAASRFKGRFGGTSRIGSSPDTADKTGYKPPYDTVPHSESWTHNISSLEDIKSGLAGDLDAEYKDPLDSLFDKKGRLKIKEEVDGLKIELTNDSFNTYRFKSNEDGVPDIIFSVFKLNNNRNLILFNDIQNDSSYVLRVFVQLPSSILGGKGWFYELSYQQASRFSLDKFKFKAAPMGDGYMRTNNGRQFDLKQESTGAVPFELVDNIDQNLEDFSRAADIRHDNIAAVYEFNKEKLESTLRDLGIPEGTDKFDEIMDIFADGKFRYNGLFAKDEEIQDIELDLSKNLELFSFERDAILSLPLKPEGCLLIGKTFNPIEYADSPDINMIWVRESDINNFSSDPDITHIQKGFNNNMYTGTFANGPTNQVWIADGSSSIGKLGRRFYEVELVGGTPVITENKGQQQYLSDDFNLVIQTSFVPKGELKLSKDVDEIKKLLKKLNYPELKEQLTDYPYIQAFAEINQQQFEISEFESGNFKFLRIDYGQDHMLLVDETLTLIQIIGTQNPQVTLMNVNNSPHSSYSVDELQNQFVRLRDWTESSSPGTWISPIIETEAEELISQLLADLNQDSGGSNVPEQTEPIDPDDEEEEVTDIEPAEESADFEQDEGATDSSVLNISDITPIDNGYGLEIEGTRITVVRESGKTPRVNRQENYWVGPVMPPVKDGDRNRNGVVLVTDDGLEVYPLKGRYFGKFKGEYLRGTHLFKTKTKSANVDYSIYKAGTIGIDQDSESNERPGIELQNPRYIMKFTHTSGEKQIQVELMNLSGMLYLKYNDGGQWKGWKEVTNKQYLLNQESIQIEPDPSLPGFVVRDVLENGNGAIEVIKIQDKQQQVDITQKVIGEKISIDVSVESQDSEAVPQPEEEEGIGDLFELSNRAKDVNHISMIRQFSWVDDFYLSLARGESISQFVDQHIEKMNVYIDLGRKPENMTKSGFAAIILFRYVEHNLRNLNITHLNYDQGLGEEIGVQLLTMRISSHMQSAIRTRVGNNLIENLTSKHEDFVNNNKEYLNELASPDDLTPERVITLYLLVTLSAPPKVKEYFEGELIDSIDKLIAEWWNLVDEQQAKRVITAVLQELNIELYRKYEDPDAEDPRFKSFEINSVSVFRGGPNISLSPFSIWGLSLAVEKFTNRDFRTANNLDVN